MNRKELDRLSAVIDSEASHQVMLEVSHRISRDEAVRNTLLRYQMIGDSLRGEEINPRSAELVLAVSRRLEAEPTVLAPGAASSRISRWLQPVAGVAIAASVAAAAVMLAPRFINGGGTSAPPSAAGLQVVARPPVAGGFGPEPATVAAADTPMRWKTLRQDAEAADPRLGRYLEQHSRYATRNGLQSMIPYTSLVSYGGASGQASE